MSGYKEIERDLISLAQEGTFDVIAHGCNCFCTQKNGIAKDMARTFDTDSYSLEDLKFKADIKKLGQIQYDTIQVHNGEYMDVVNCYTQFNFATDKNQKPFDYFAFNLCMKKINHIFRGKHIGLPKIGAGLAGGDWEIIKKIIKQELKDCSVTIVIKK